MCCSRRAKRSAHQHSNMTRAGLGHLMHGLQVCDWGLARRGGLRSVQRACKDVSQQLVLQDFNHAWRWYGPALLKHTFMWNRTDLVL